MVREVEPMGEQTPIERARGHLQEDRALEAMHILMEAWNAGPGDPVLRLELARVGKVMKSLRHRQILCRDIGEGDARFGREIDGRYLILKRISESPGATLYLAQDEVDGGEVTLWHLDPLWRNSPLDQEWVLKRLERLGQFSHPGAARLLKIGAPEDDMIYAAFEPADGSLVSDCISTAGPLPLARAIEVVTDILETISAAHQAGVLHCNLRPDHIALRSQGVRILDLGLYVLVRELHRSRKVTRTGQVPGAVAYLPPEFDGPADPNGPWEVCSAGTLAFEIITGQPPYGRPGPRQLRSYLTKMKAPELPKPSLTAGGKGLPEWVDGILAKMLARDPQERYQTPAEALAAWQEHV